MNENIEILNTANEYIDALTNGVKQAVNYFQGGEEREGSNLILQIADGIEWLVKALIVSKDLINADENINSLNEKLAEMVEAFENEDYILLSDLLEYELLSILDEIQGNIRIVVQS